MTIYGGPEIVTDGLVLHLDAANSKSYPGSGTTWNDLSGNGNNGTLTNGPTFSSNNKGGIVFDGINDHIALPSLGTFSKSSNITIETWVYSSATPSTTKSIVTQYSTSTYFDCGLASNSTGYFFAYSEQGAVAADYATDTVPYNINQWYYVVGIYDTSYVWLYVNGIYRTKTAYNTTLSSVSNNPVWYIGKFRQNSTDYYHWTGNISNTKVYTRALSASEVLQNYNATKGRYGL